MSPVYVVSLAVVVVAVLSARFLLPRPALPRSRNPVTTADLALAGAGVLGLTFHCGAMFFRSLVEALPGTDAAIGQIDALGLASVVWYVVPAAMVLAGLRRQSPVAVGVAALALVAVGVTMYDGGSVSTHLSAIFLTVVALAGIASTLVVGPSRPAAALRNA